MKSFTLQNATALGQIISLIGSLVLCAAILPVLLKFNVKMASGIFAALGSFLLLFMVLIRTANTCTYRFDTTSQRIVLGRAWFKMFRYGGEEIPFADIDSVFLRNSEASDVIIVLRSRRKLNPKTGSIRQVRNACEMIAAAAGKSEVSPGVWR
jgi:hypothetical protein